MEHFQVYQKNIKGDYEFLMDLMKINIYSENIYLKKAFNELVSFMSNADVICAKNIFIIDLTSVNELSIEGLVELDICHMILLSGSPCIQEWLGGKRFGFEMHVISNKIPLTNFLGKMGEILRKIRMRKCLCFSEIDIRNHGKTAIANLSPREKEVLRYYLRRFSARDIATEMGISIKSVSAYKNSAMKKMKLSGNIFQLTKGIQQIVVIENIVNLRNEWLVRKPSWPPKCDLRIIQDTECRNFYS